MLTSMSGPEKGIAILCGSHAQIAAKPQQRFDEMQLLKQPARIFSYYFNGNSSDILSKAYQNPSAEVLNSLPPRGMSAFKGDELSSQGLKAVFSYYHDLRARHEETMIKKPPAHANQSSHGHVGNGRLVRVRSKHLSADSML